MFGPHMKSVSEKAAKTGANLSRLIPGTGGPNEKKRRMLASTI